MTDSTRIGFVMERALGHVTYAQNLRQWVDADPGVRAHWMMIAYQSEDLWQQIPGLPFSVRLSLRARDAIRRLTAREPLDCLFVHTQNLSLFSAGIMRRIPTVISLDATPIDFRSMAAAYGSRPASGLADRAKHAWFRRVFSRAAGLVGMSDWVKESLVRDYGVPPGKVEVIPLGVDVRRWQCPPRQPAPGRRLRLLFVGGEFRRKGGQELLDAFTHGLSGICELDVVTKEPVNSAAGHVRVHSGLTPNSAALQRLFAEADLFLLPTRGDGTPFAILEAMAAGLPVVTTRVGGIGEMVEEGVTGFFIPPAHPRAIVDVVTGLAADRGRLATMGRAARLAVEQRFDAGINCRRLIAYLRDIGRRRPGGSRQT